MIILDSHIEGASEYPPRVRGELYRAIVEYCHYGTEPAFLKGEAKGFFIAIRPTLDTQRARAEAGRAGGSKRTSKREANAKQNASKREANAKQTQEQNASEVEVEVEEENTPNGVPKKRPPAFVPPTAAEVAAYAADAGIGLDAGEFVDYYGAQGWRLSNGNRMRDWKAAARRWARKREPGGGAYLAEYD